MHPCTKIRYRYHAVVPVKLIILVFRLCAYKNTNGWFVTMINYNISMNFQNNIPDFNSNDTRAVLHSRSGRSVTVRRVTADDGKMLAQLYNNLSPESVELRFFGTGPAAADEVERQAHRLAQLNPTRHLALMACIIENDVECAIGVARYGLDTSDLQTAEFAVVIRDDFQNDGFGSQLLELLTLTARANGVKRLRIVWRSQNRAVQRLILSAKLPRSSETHSGETTTLLEL